MNQVLIVEDQKMMREAMENYISQMKGYSIIASISRASEAIKICNSFQVDLILMDVCTDCNESGFTATKEIKEKYPKIKVIIVSSMLDVDYMKRARNVKADSLWFKDISQMELIHVIEQTMQGKEVYPDSMPVIQIGNAKSYEFTETEIKVLRLLVEGMTYKEMAKELNVSSDCIKKHISHMLSKTGFSSKTKLAAMVTSKKMIINGF
ncbi:response regulator [Floccifex sp.]|uniref:response regulator n=1 Tax=Floccifex sp. TaxID=2815810 RepID=UPI003F05026C